MTHLGRNAIAQSAKDVPVATPHHHDHTSATDAGHAPGSSRWTRRRLVLMILTKLGLVALLLVLPAGLAISLGAAHVVVVLLIVAGGAVALVIRKRRGSAPRAARSHRFLQSTDPLRRAADIIKNRSDP
jgi:hypothetical protein